MPPVIWFFCSILLLSGRAVPVSGSRVLFLLPISSKSMANVFEPLAVELAKRGHKITIVSPTNFKIPDSNKNVTQLIPASADELFKDFPEPIEQRRQNSLFRFPVAFTVKHCNTMYNNKEFRNIMNEKFDVVVMNLYYHDCFAGLLYKMGAPLIQVSSLPLTTSFAEMWGAHQPSSFVPLAINTDVSALKMTFKQRTKNFLYNWYFSIMLDSWTRPILEDLYRERLSDAELPSILETFKNQTSIVLVNAHHALTGPRPTLPNIIDIGGIHCRPGNKLPVELEDFVSGAKEGAIVFSLGSIVKATNMPESIRLVFLSVFAKLKERVIWKWEKEGGMQGLPENVKVVKWLPQQDLLAHPNVKLFITHGGLLSTEEAAYHGVPVLGMPIFVDQDSNMIQAESLGFGLKGEILDITEEKLTSYIHRILDDGRFMKKAKELSSIFRDSLETPLERAVFGTEHVLRHKGAYHMKSAAMELNMIQYHSIDIVIFLVGGFLLIILVIYTLVKVLVTLLRRYLRLGSVKLASQKQYRKKLN